ncbi:hypothetical protein BOTBODRAFT_47775 [Botryobasidium botryosum FD-172 SS1]|uniref:Uncharacterized protein n=1 Tax=Botryobasidium botryosum (strain FD-172 SS1) TaxID=930990 RepID=A0A067M3E8_BOTB1|nr:hypothetical protein BOTBODRAFT_47775 [Botryobasidium botryosum FD-172 SS1]
MTNAHSLSEKDHTSLDNQILSRLSWLQLDMEPQLDITTLLAYIVLYTESVYKERGMPRTSRFIDIFLAMKLGREICICTGIGTHCTDELKAPAVSGDEDQFRAFALGDSVQASNATMDQTMRVPGACGRHGIPHLKVLIELCGSMLSAKSNSCWRILCGLGSLAKDIEVLARSASRIMANIRSRPQYLDFVTGSGKTRNSRAGPLHSLAIPSHIAALCFAKPGWQQVEEIANLRWLWRNSIECLAVMRVFLALFSGFTPAASTHPVRQRQLFATPSTRREMHVFVHIRGYGA